MRRAILRAAYHALMPRAHRRCIEPSDHVVLGHLSIPGPSSGRWATPHAAKRFIGLAIGVRTKRRALCALRNNFLFTMRSGTTRAAQRIMAKLFSARSRHWRIPALSLMDRWAEPPPRSTDFISGVHA